MVASSNTAARDTRRASRLGDTPVCEMGCGETDPVTSLYEKHHIAGRRNDPELTSRICRNCHAKMTEGLRAAGVSMMTPPTDLHALAALIGGLAEFLANLAASLTGWARWIERVIEALEAMSPAWRDALAGLPSPRSLAVQR